MNNRKKSVLAGVLCAAALGTYLLFPKPVDPPLKERTEDRISYYSEELTFSNVKALPALKNDANVWVWSVYNDEAISFYVKKNDRQTFEIMLCDLDNPKTLYQIVVDFQNDKVDAYKYVGGLWHVNGDHVRHDTMHRVLWMGVDDIVVDTDDTNIEIKFPWTSIEGIDNNDRIGIQIIEGVEGDKAWDSNDPRTSFLDRRTWNQLRINKR